MDSNDRNLGMDRAISRRDFLNGLAISTAFSPRAAAALGDPLDPEKSPGYYPPALTGMRGDHDDIYQIPHAVRDGDFWKNTTAVASATGETFDLVIVGGGISGLAAAHFYRKVAGPNSRILILDNHDDFGGHAKRNEFHQTGSMLLGYGGTFSIESPWPYSNVAKGLIEELGIDVPSTARVLNRKLYSSLGLKSAVFFDKETFGTDRLVPEPKPEWYEDEPETNSDARWQAFFAKAPMADQAKHDLRRLHDEKKDYLPGLSSPEKKARMARMSYAKYLTDCAGMHPDVIRYFQARPYSLFGVGIDAVSAQDAWGLGFPGFEGLQLDPKFGPGMNRDAMRSEEAERYFYHFPDGNSSIARLLVRSLIPGAVPGHNAVDIVDAHTNYALLDQESNNTRLRLNSTVVRVAHNGTPVTAKSVEITYSRLGKLQKVQGKQCILACWHVMIPYICSELPPGQKDALAFAVKVPLVYTNVVIRNWTAFQKLGVSSIYAPGSFHSEVNLDLPVSLGDYHCPTQPDQSIVVHMQRVPCHPGLPAREQHRAGRLNLFNTSFADFERNIRDQLARSVSPGGFDPARDIAAITVNRWPHGYAYEYNSLWDKFWLDGGPQPCVAARQRFHRIAIANSDAGAYAYTDCAIDQGHRAVTELLHATG